MVVTAPQGELDAPAEVEGGEAGAGEEGRFDAEQLAVEVDGGRHVADVDDEHIGTDHGWGFLRERVYMLSTVGALGASHMAGIKTLFASTHGIRFLEPE